MIPKSLSVYIDDDSTVRQGTEKMRYHRYVAIPILDADGRYVGTLRNDDILNYFTENKHLTRRDLERTHVMAVADTSCKPLPHDATFERLVEEVKERTKAEGMTWYDWNADGKDSLGELLSPEEIAENVLSSEFIGSEKVIVLLHDSSTRTTTPKALKLLISRFREMGYEFGKLD
jgi:CBS domain-containing protein